MSFKSQVFDVRTINMNGTTEQIVKGGRDLLHLLPDALKGISQIGVIGWGSQGPAQAQNLRDSLEGTDIKVVVGLRNGSSSFAKARKAGFYKKDGTAGEMFDVIKSSDLVILLISDAAQTDLYPEIFKALKPGATLGLSHGFLLGHMNNVGDNFPENHNVVMVAPKGMGDSVRKLYVQGETTNGAGINASFAVQQDVDGRATDIALAWSLGIGSPYTFETTMEMEFKSDIFGERAILLGGVWGIVEGLFGRFKVAKGLDIAFQDAVESLTGPINSMISDNGLFAVFEALDISDRDTFATYYSAAYNASMPIIAEIYDEVASGNEIRGVNLAGARLDKYPMTKVDGTQMWQIGERVRAARTENSNKRIDPMTAGVYIGVMMAQIDLLIDKGHSWSEIANESVIEATDSLNPYMHARGIAYMVDGCSRTARLGAYRWGPRFRTALESRAFVDIDNGKVEMGIFNNFGNHPIHEALRICGELRPSVKISLT